jgi:hypothetical protein
MLMEIPRMGVPDELAVRLSMAEQYEYLNRARVSRRALLRAGTLGTGAALVAPSLSGTASAASPTLLTRASAAEGARVAPYGRHLAFGADPRRQMRIAWQVPVPVEAPFARVGRRPWDLGEKIQAEVRPLHSALPKGVVDQYYLHVSLDGLSPGTTYFYGVGHSGFDPADATAYGTVASFTTAPARGRTPGPFTFTAFGDQGVSYHALGNDSVLLAQDPAFHLHAGDIAYANATGFGLPDDTFDPQVWDQFLAQTELVAARVPWMVAMGNHDMEALYSADGYGGQLARFDFPGNGPAHCPSVYSFIYGNLGVICLDANDVSYEFPANLGHTDGSQTAWLEDRLRFLRQQSDVDFVVAYFHHCAYSTTKQHASEGGVRNHWVPLFDRYKVDLVITGHNHVYERTDPLRGGARITTAPIGATVWPEKDGIVYATAGGGGYVLYGFPVPDSYESRVRDLDSVPSYYWGDDGEKVTETVDWSRVRYTGYSFLTVDVAPAREGRTTTMTVRALAENGAEIDRFTVARTAGLVTGDTRGVGAASTDLGAF